MVRRRRGARAGDADRLPLADAGEGAGAHGRGHARARHRRQRRHLQCRPRRAAAAARQPRRGPTGLPAPERDGDRQSQHDLLSTRDRRLQGARHDHRQLRRLLDHRFHHDRLRRAARRQGRRRRRLLLRGHGTAAGARPLDQPRRRRRGGGWRRSPDLPVLDDVARQRSHASSAGRSVSGRAPRRSSGSSSPRCHIPPIRRSSPTSSPAPTISARRW